MNCNTQNAKIASITEKTLIVGIDVGGETHYARAFDWRNYEYTRKPLEFSNTEAGFQTFKAWMEDIAEKYGKNVVIPGMEPTGHYWFNLGKFLQDNGMRPVHVNPHHVKKSKELDDNNPNKNDRKDPKTIAALVNEGRFSYPYIPAGIYAEIRSLSNLRFQTQEELTYIYKDVLGFSVYLMYQTILVHKTVLEKIGYLDENVVAFQELDTAIRIAQNNDIVYITKPLFVYSIHDTIYKNQKRALAGMRYLFDKHYVNIVEVGGKESLAAWYMKIAYRYDRTNWKHYWFIFLSSFCRLSVLR